MERKNTTTTRLGRKHREANRVLSISLDEILRELRREIFFSCVELETPAYRNDALLGLPWKRNEQKPNRRGLPPFGPCESRCRRRRYPHPLPTQEPVSR